LPSSPTPHWLEPESSLKVAISRSSGLNDNLKGTVMTGSNAAQNSVGNYQSGLGQMSSQSAAKINAMAQQQADMSNALIGSSLSNLASAIAPGNIVSNGINPNTWGTALSSATTDKTRMQITVSQIANGYLIEHYSVAQKRNIQIYCKDLADVGQKTIAAYAAEQLED